jgi:hypothetical protein
MFKIPKINLILIFLIVFIILTGFFTVKWSQIKEELREETIENGGGNREREAEVIITTDKREYEQAEIIEISVKNNLDRSIWYRRQGPSEIPPFWKLEKFEENKWEIVYFYLPLWEEEKEICIIRFHEAPTWYIDELKANSEISHQWNQKICPFDRGDRFEPELIQKGRYRFIFKFGLRKIHLPKPKEEPWKGEEDLTDIKIIYSNEFTIK